MESQFIGSNEGPDLRTAAAEPPAETVELVDELDETEDVSPAPDSDAETLTVETKAAPDSEPEPASEPELPDHVREQLAAKDEELRQHRQAQAEMQRIADERRDQEALTWIDGESQRVLGQIHYNARQANLDYDTYQRYVATETQKLLKWQGEQHLALRGQEQQKFWNAYSAAKAPTYAERIAKENKLTADDAKTLLKYPPNLMEIVAKDLAAERVKQASTGKRADQAARSIAARDRLASGADVSGSGRAGSRQIKRGSDDHLAFILGRG